MKIIIYVEKSDMNISLYFADYIENAEVEI